ncbi:MAG TPA: purine-nucleoside phosphorylase [Egibacteraceae bacterium]|nr:purine-nucleoside phosphorylase [Egibacteraceae bacterium]
MSSQLRARLDGFAPRVLLTLGSGLGSLADEVADAAVIPYAEVGLPTSTVPGHAGKLIAGSLHGVPVLVQQGRVHLYEGRSPAEVTAVVRAAGEAGAEAFIVTNAAGGLDPTLEQGDVALLGDQLNLTGADPLIGLPEVVFVDMGQPYDAALRALAREAAESAGERLRDAVYAGLSGPAFETPAEVRMLRTLGADVVGMSTVLEVIAARAAGLRVLGFSVVTNVHRPGAVTDHAEVLEAGASAGPRLAAVLRALLPRLADALDRAGG